MSWMMDEFMYWPKPSLLLSATCGEKVAWMIDFWMESHWVSDSNGDTLILQSQQNDKE